MPSPQVEQPPSRSSWRRRPGCPPACPISRRGAWPPALGRSWAAPVGPGDEWPRLCRGCKQDAVARDPGTQTLMPVPRHPCAFSSDPWPQADASQVSSEVTPLENMWHLRVQRAFVFGTFGKVTGVICKSICVSQGTRIPETNVEYTLIQPNLLQICIAVLSSHSSIVGSLSPLSYAFELFERLIISLSGFQSVFLAHHHASP